MRAAIQPGGEGLAAVSHRHPGRGRRADARGVLSGVRGEGVRLEPAHGLRPGRRSIVEAPPRPDPARGQNAGSPLAALTVEERAEEIVGVFFKAIKDGDWRAAEALLTRVYGKPQEKLEVSQPQTLEDVERMSLAEIRHLRSVIESDSSS